jgi:hypothetical protein
MSKYHLCPICKNYNCKKKNYQYDQDTCDININHPKKCNNHGCKKCGNHSCENKNFIPMTKLTDKVDMNYHKIKHLAPGTKSTDAVNMKQLLSVNQNLSNVLCEGNSAGNHDIDMNCHRINNLCPGYYPSDAVNVSQLSSVNSSLSDVLAKDNSAGTSEINMNNNKITNLAPGTNPMDAVNVSQLSLLEPSLSDVLIKGNSAGTSVINMNNNKITNLAPGTNPTDAINLSQLSSLEPSLSDVLAKGNSAGTFSIDMNNQNINNTNQISTSLISEQVTGNGINMFYGYGTSGIRVCYSFSGQVNTATITTLLTVPLQSDCVYTVLVVGGYYCNTISGNLAGNNYIINSVRIGPPPVIINMINFRYSDILNDYIFVDISGTNMLIQLNTTTNDILNIKGTVDIWRHY